MNSERGRPHGLIGDQRHLGLGSIRGAKQQFLDFARTGIGIHPDLHRSLAPKRNRKKPDSIVLGATGTSRQSSARIGKSPMASATQAVLTRGGAYRATQTNGNAAETTSDEADVHSPQNDSATRLSK